MAAWLGRGVGGSFLDGFIPGGGGGGGVWVVWVKTAEISTRTKPVQMITAVVETGANVRLESLKSTR